MTDNRAAATTEWAIARVRDVSTHGLVLDLRPAEPGRPVNRVYFTHATLLDFLTMVERHRGPEHQPKPQTDPEQQGLPW